MDLNKAMIIGRLTRDPELRNTPNGKAVATIGLATNRVWIDGNGQKQKQTEFHNVVMWGKLAEICSQYLRKGGKMYVEGRLQTREWTGQDGVKRYRTEIVGENMIMLDSKSAGTTSAPSSGPSDTAFGSEAPQEVIEEEVKVEDIPF
ncbi:MAG: single-stranded DNA-binding protein [Candidatus Magasanikbacteria bacterium]|nr:single-stranded DNA-binding protein [Candidatus Magasanikbacteria bacterium]